MEGKSLAHVNATNINGRARAADLGGLSPEPVFSITFPYMPTEMLVVCVVCLCMLGMDGMLFRCYRNETLKTQTHIAY